MREETKNTRHLWKKAVTREREPPNLKNAPYLHLWWSLSESVKKSLTQQTWEFERRDIALDYCKYTATLLCFLLRCSLLSITQAISLSFPFEQHWHLHCFHLSWFDCWNWRNDGLGTWVLRKLPCVRSLTQSGRRVTCNNDIR